MVNAANLDQVAEAGLTQVCLGFLFVCLFVCFKLLVLYVSCQVFCFNRSSFSVRLLEPKSESALSLSETLRGDMTYL